MTISLEPIVRLGRDLVKAIDTLTGDEARYLVDAYYSMQKNRIGAANQCRAMGEEPHQVLEWLNIQSDTLEAQIRRALGVYAESQDLGKWAMAQVGIGPVIAAGLLAHIDLEKAPTVGHIWRFAGLDPTMIWEKGKKRPFNASLKTLCWKIGESFVKVSGRADAVYAQIYKKRKELEIERNERGEFAEQAAKMLATRPTHAQRSIYALGKLPDGHIHARAKRYAVKLFLAHYWERGRELSGLPVPLPYPIAILGHAHHLKAA
jgi:hypothetical protein